MIWHIQCGSYCDEFSKQGNENLRATLYDTKYKKDIPVEYAKMFDVNKTIMRCLVKNLAMFGFRLYVYSGEDLLEIEIIKKSLLLKK